MRQCNLSPLLRGSLGAAGLAILLLALPGASSQDPRTQDPERERGARMQDGQDFKEAQQKLRQSVLEHVQRQAQQKNAQIDPSKLLISLMERSLIAGAPTRGDATPTGRRPVGGEDPADERGGRPIDLDADAIEGIIVISGSGAHDGTYKAVCLPATKAVVLEGEAGQTALRFPLIETPMGGPIEAGTPRRGEPGERGERDDERGRGQNPQDRGSRNAAIDLGKPEWSTVYTSIVYGLSQRR